MRSLWHIYAGWTDAVLKGLVQANQAFPLSEELAKREAKQNKKGCARILDAIVLDFLTSVSVKQLCPE